MELEPISLGLFFDEARQFGDDLEQIPNNAVVSHVKNRRIRICVNGHNTVGPFHPDCMLYSPRNSASEVKSWGDILTRTSYLAFSL